MSASREAPSQRDQRHESPVNQQKLARFHAKAAELFGQILRAGFWGKVEIKAEVVVEDGTMQSMTLTTTEIDRDRDR